MASPPPEDKHSRDSRDNLKGVLREITRVMEAGDRIDPELYLDRYPKLAPELKRFFEEQAVDDEADDVDDLRPGMLIDDYRIRSVIGRGGMGVVYEADQLSLRRIVALKVLRPGATKSLDRFKREASAVARLSHPRIVAVHGFNQSKGLTYLAMERVDGLDLAEIIDRLRAARTHGRRYLRISGPGLKHEWSEGVASRADVPGEGLVIDLRNYAHVAAAMAADAADALRHAHAHGVIHRDIKPSNLIVGPNGRVKLSDFGLAKTMESGSLTNTGDFVGSPQYVSPEQASSRRVKVDERTDVYSLGVTLYELLTLHQPFAGKNIHVVLKQIMTKTPPLPSRLNPRVPRDLETIVMKAIEKDPNRRYQSAEALGDDLRRFLNYEPIKARPLGPLGRVIRTARQRPAAAALGVMGVVIVGLVAALVFGTDGRAVRLARGGMTHATESAGATELLDRVETDRKPGQRFRMAAQLDRQIRGALERDQFDVVDRLLLRAEIQIQNGLWGEGEAELLATYLADTKLELLRRVTLALEGGPLAAAMRRSLLVLVERQLADSDPRVLTAATMTLGRVRSVSSLGAMLDALSGREDPAGRITLVRALAGFGDRGAVPYLVDLSHSPEADLRFAALAAIASLDPPGWADDVSHLGQDEQSWIRHHYKRLARGTSSP